MAAVNEPQHCVDPSLIVKQRHCAKLKTLRAIRSYKCNNCSIFRVDMKVKPPMAGKALHEDLL